jgi:prophage antirepressor-like protein
MSEIQIFENEQFGSIRIIEIDGMPWFVGKEVAVVLGYSKPLDAISRHIDEDDSVKHGLIDSVGRIQNTILINESGLYSLILSSKLPSAKAFKRWVTSEVLPTIRRHGFYATDETLDNMMNDTETAEKLFKELKAEKIRTRELEKKNHLLSEKANYYDNVLASETLIPITFIAKDYGMSAVKLNAMLYAYGIQYKLRETWVLYCDYQDKGYTQSVTIIPNGDVSKTKLHTYWTEKGREFLYDFLKTEGLFPVCELQNL